MVAFGSQIVSTEFRSDSSAGTASFPSIGASHGILLRHWLESLSYLVRGVGRTDRHLAKEWPCSAGFRIRGRRAGQQPDQVVLHIANFDYEGLVHGPTRRKAAFPSL